MSIERVGADQAGPGSRARAAGLLARLHGSARGFDISLAVFMAAVTIIGSMAENHPAQRADQLPHGQQFPASPAPVYLLVAVSALALIWRRRAPLATLAVSLAAALAYTSLGYVNGSVMLNPVVAVYAVAVATPPARAIAVSALTLAALMGVSAAFDPFGPTGAGFVLIPGLIAAPLFLGLWVASRRAYGRRDSEEHARRAVDAERLRIARELHDVVSHTMATINVQAGAAGHVIGERPDEAAAALESIRRASKEGLRELRGILNVLRQADEADQREPAPRLAQLDALVDGTVRSGLETTVRIEGDPRPLPATVDLTAYRIVQESLTNALRHAGPTTASVTVSYEAAALVVEVADRGCGAAPNGGPGASPARAGLGIAGMRERAQAAGGTLQAGTGPDGGFLVRARLPIGDGS